MVLLLTHSMTLQILEMIADVMIRDRREMVYNAVV